MSYNRTQLHSYLGGVSDEVHEHASNHGVQRGYAAEGKFTFRSRRPHFCMYHVTPRNRSRLAPTIVAVVLGLLLGGENATAQQMRSHRATVAILVSAQRNAYDDAIRGFKASSDLKVIGEFQMRGDIGEGERQLEQIEALSPDLILAVGSLALQIVVQQETTINIVFAMVLNPHTVAWANLTNVTGASMNVPIEQSLQVLRDLGPGIRRVGIVIDPKITGDLVSRARELAPALGLELIIRSAGSTGEVLEAMDGLTAQAVDVVWILPDTKILHPRIMEELLLLSYRKKIPMLGLSRRHTKMGALASLSFASGEDIGRQAAELARRIVEGTPPSAVPFTMAREVDLTVNLKTAKRIDFPLPEFLLSHAIEVIR